MADKPFSAEEIAAFEAADAKPIPQATHEFTPEELAAFHIYEGQIADQKFKQKTTEEAKLTPWLLGAAPGAGVTAFGMGAGKGIDVAKSMMQDKVPPSSVIRTDNPLYQGHDLHQGAITNAEFNAQQRLANELRTTPGINSVVDSLLRDRSAMAPLNAEAMRQEIEANKPLGTKVVDKLGKADNALVRGTSRLGGGAGAGYNAVAGVQHAMEPGMRNKIAAAINAAGAGLGGAAAVAPKGGRASALRPLMTAGSAGLGWLANQIAEENSKAAGGAVGHYGPGGLIKLASKAPQAVEEYAKPVLKKFSEALGDVGAEGKWLGATQSDRTIVGNGQKGGTGFPGLQHTDPAHAAINAVWGVGKPEPATLLVNANKKLGNNLILTNYVGSPYQHSSNPMVLSDLHDSFMDAVRSGKVSPEEIKAMNARLASDVYGNVFDKSIDITDPQFLKAADTFDKRRIAGKVYSGEGLTKAIPGNGADIKKGQVIPFDDIMSHYTEPVYLNHPTSGLLGNRLFTLDNTVTHNPDIHEGFPWILGGKDFKVEYDPVNATKAMPDFVAKKKAMKEAKGVSPNLTSYDWLRGLPLQFADDKYLSYLQKEGMAGGGKVDDAKKFHLSTGALEDLFSGQISPSQFPAAAKHDLTHFPKTDKKQVDQFAQDMAMNYGPMGVGALGAGVIKNVGGQWSNQMTKELSDRLADRYGNKDLSNWLQTTGKKYILNRAGSPADEVRKLMDQGISHMSPTKLSREANMLPRSEIKSILENRSKANFPMEGLATTDPGREWEALSDSLFYNRPAEDYSILARDDMPWLSKLDPKTPIHSSDFSSNVLSSNLGFDELTDALRKDMASGKLRPEQLNKVSMEDAVRRAHQQRLQAEQAASKLDQSIPKVKEYPSGYAWHDLTHEDPHTLDAILKKEGDTMQNCIGGYCSDVLEDGTKLYSLRDAKGEPHVNVEVRQGQNGPTIRQVRGKQNELPTKDYLPYVQDFALNPIEGAPYSNIWGAGDLGLHDVNKIKEHGLVEGSMGPYYGALDRLFPTEIDPMGGRVLAGQHGVKIPTTKMLQMSTEDLPGRYVTQEQILEHLNAQEPRPIEQGYSKYYQGTE